MTKELIIILACVPLYVINAFCDKRVSLKNGNQYNYLYNCVKFMIGSACIIPLLFLEGSYIFAIGSLLCGAFSGVMYAVGKTATLKGYDKTSVAFITLCHASGMILPCILGHFFWNEKLSGVAVFGILLAVFSIVLIKGREKDKKSLDIKGIVFGLLVFLTSAGGMIAQKLMGIYFPDQSSVVYSFYAYAVAFLLLSPYVKPKQVKEMERSAWKTILPCAVGSAGSLLLINFVMVGLAGAVPSIILFPLFNGLGVILVCVSSAVCFKEKISVSQWIGLILALVGLFFVNC